MNLPTWLTLAPEQLTPEQVRQLGQALGGLAPWWLRPDVLDRYEEERGWRFPAKPQLPRTHGSCWIVLVRRDEQLWPALRPAFFLPLHWQKGAGWDKRLPGTLLALAKEIAVELELLDYSLHLHPAVEPAPVLPVPPGDFEFDSAAISLAGGLYLAARDGEPDPEVGASACWKKSEGVGRVSLAGLKKKLDLAAEGHMRTFFVAGEQLAEAKAYATEVEVLGLPQGRSRLATAIQEFVVRQKAEPAAPTALDDETGLQRNVEHWKFLPAEHQPAFYQRRLSPWVLARFADLITQEAKVAQAPRLKALVTIVSGQIDTIILAARALSRLGICDCVLLYSQDPKKEQESKAHAIKAKLANPLELSGEPWPSITCWPVPFDPNERLLDQLANAVRAYCCQFQNEELLLDITGGKTLMRWVADHAMPAGSWRFCLENEYVANRPQPLTERLRLWRSA